MFIQDLIEKIGTEKVSQNETDLYRHSQDESPHEAWSLMLSAFLNQRKIY
ncbi:hypothetical protein [Evansella sp. LMS18]|jgi:hypothetical protein